MTSHAKQFHYFAIDLTHFGYDTSMGPRDKAEMIKGHVYPLPIGSGLHDIDKSVVIVAMGITWIIK